MATANQIHNMYSPFAMGDVEKYFVKLDRMMGMNSGVNDYSVVSHNCYATSVPFTEGCFTKFKLTDEGYDITDISQGYLHFNVTFDVTFEHIRNEQSYVASAIRNGCYFFVGLKSGAQIIDNYKIYSNGRLTACNQMKSKHEQAIVFNCKSKDQKNGRPGVYSAHENVLKMSNCVCGFYIQQPLGMYLGKKTELECKMEIIVQLDDLLPFSGMRYFPNFACGDLEIEVSLSLEKALVWCQIPYQTTIGSKLTARYDNTELYTACTQLFKGFAEPSKYEGDLRSVLPLLKIDPRILDAGFGDYRFNQCGDYSRVCLGLCPDHNDANSGPNPQGIEQSYNYPQAEAPTKLGIDTTLVIFMTYMTITPSNLTVVDAKSFVYGFNIKPETKQNILSIFKQEKKLTVPAQWIEHQIFNQKPSYEDLKMQLHTPLYQVSQLILTFPNSDNQLTVSRNPYLQNIKCQIDGKMIPDKPMSTIDNSFAEMNLIALGFDNYFRASDTLINSYIPLDNSLSYDYTRTPNVFRDDSDFMFVVDLERNGNGVHHDGYSSDNALINLDARYINGAYNMHYYKVEYEKIPTFNTTQPASRENPAIREVIRHYPISPNLYIISDAYWVFTPNGGEFIKDLRAISLMRERERNIEMNHAQ